MKNVTNTLELMAAAGNQGVALNDTEAEILLGYLEGHDYCLKMGKNRRLWLHDNQDGEKDDNDDAYTIRDVIELCQELNGEILLEEESKQTPKQNYILELKKDKMLLERMMEKAAVAVPPEIREYKVQITEHLTKTVSVNGESWADAELKAREAYDRGEIVLSADDFAGVIFLLGG